MSDPKTHFNDSYHGPTRWEICCPTCRAETYMEVVFYPHTNHRHPSGCPFCGDRDVTIKEAK